MVHRQGLILDCAPLEFETMNAFPPASEAAAAHGSSTPVWLALDEVTDPVGGWESVAKPIPVVLQLLAASNTLDEGTDPVGGLDSVAKPTPVVLQLIAATNLKLFPSKTLHVNPARQFSD